MSIVCGMVHSDRTVVVWFHKRFSSGLSTLGNAISIITNSMYTVWFHLHSLAVDCVLSSLVKLI